MSDQTQSRSSITGASIEDSRCTNCDTEVPEGTAMCHYCGAAFQGAIQADESGEIEASGTDWEGDLGSNPKERALGEDWPILVSALGMLLTLYVVIQVEEGRSLAQNLVTPGFFFSAIIAAMVLWLAIYHILRVFQMLRILKTTERRYLRADVNVAALQKKCAWLRNAICLTFFMGAIPVVGPFLIGFITGWKLWGIVPAASAASKGVITGLVTIWSLMTLSRFILGGGLFGGIYGLLIGGTFFGTALTRIFISSVAAAVGAAIGGLLGGSPMPQDDVL